MTDHDVLGAVHTLLDGKELTEAESQALFTQVVLGKVDDILLAAVLAALKVRTQTPREMAGAARALLENATPFPRPQNTLFADVVGTGGDGHNTINLSTIASITAAACGVKIAKHGNRSISSVSGSFDLLEKLGIDLQQSPDRSRECLDHFGLCFLFAPQYHAGMRHAGPVRKTLSTRTLFNLLGPLVNPARPPLMLLGVAHPELLQPMAEVLNQLDCQSAFVVHGSGVDEVAIHGSTTIVELADQSLRTYELQPADFGARPAPLEALVCHEAGESHDRSLAVLEGRGSEAENSAVSVNVSLVMKLAGHGHLKKNFTRAMDTLKSGRPMDLVQQMTT